MGKQSLKLNVTDMSWLFHGSSIKYINFGDNFGTSFVSNFEGMLFGMSNIIELDISKMKIKTGASISYMFGQCPLLNRIYVSENSGFENAKFYGLKVFVGDVSLVGGICMKLTIKI